MLIRYVYWHWLYTCVWSTGPFFLCTFFFLYIRHRKYIVFITRHPSKEQQMISILFQFFFHPYPSKVSVCKNECGRNVVYFSKNILFFFYNFIASLRVNNIFNDGQFLVYILYFDVIPALSFHIIFYIYTHIYKNKYISREKILYDFY